MRGAIRQRLCKLAKDRLRFGIPRLVVLSRREFGKVKTLIMGVANLVRFILLLWNIG